MKKNNSQVSQSKIKRAHKNKARQARKDQKLEKHIQFLYNLSKSNQIDIDKISTYKRYSAYLGQELVLTRSRKEVRYIIDRLVSLQEANK